MSFVIPTSMYMYIHNSIFNNNLELIYLSKKVYMRISQNVDHTRNNEEKKSIFL